MGAAEVVTAITSLGASIFGSILGSNAQKGDDKSRSSTAANAVARAVNEQIVPAYKAGKMTAEEAGQAITDAWNAYETWINSNIGDAQIAQQSIETQRMTLTNGLTAVGNPVLGYSTSYSGEGGLSVSANKLYSQGQDLTKTGISQLGQSTDYYSKILAGGKGLEEATATGISDLNNQYEKALTKMARGSMRSGATAQTAANANTSLMSEANKLKFQAKSDAASQLGKLASGEVSLGLGSEGEAGTQWGNLLSYQLAKSKQNQETTNNTLSSILGTGKAAGTAISTILSSIMGGDKSSATGGA